MTGWVPSWCGVAAIFVAAATCLGADTRRSAGRDQADFRRHPPRAVGLTVELVEPATSTARVSIEVAPDPRLTDVLTIEGDAGPFSLRAEPGGDGHTRRFTGTTRLDVDALVTRQKTLDRLASLHDGALDFPVFAGRERTGMQRVPRLEIEKLLAGKAIALPASWVSPKEIDAARSHLIVDPSVVRDPTLTSDPCTTGGAPLGKWTFGRLMKEIAGTTDAAAMTRAWLGRWETAQTVNGLTVAARPLIRTSIVDPWPRTTATGQPLDLAKAPFRLLAIVNRIDLAENLGYGSGSAGELRFVFGALSAPPACTPLRFAVIFEYAVTKASCADLRSWARAWADLSTMTLGSPAYNTALDALVDPVVRAGAAPGKPNGSALAQLRTNEIALLDLKDKPGAQEWEMREFHLDTAGALAQHTVRRTPKPEANRTAALASWVDTNAAAIVDDVYEVPDQHPAGTPFGGGHAIASMDTFWEGSAAQPIAEAAARHAFSLNTCSACHARETDTPFTHVSPAANLDQPAPLSGFLTGITVSDPVTGASRTFNDLQRRSTVLSGIANRSCLFKAFHVPLKMAH